MIIIKQLNTLYRLERKFGKFAIQNLMLYIVIGMGVLFAFDFLFPTLGLQNYFVFSKAHIMRGEIWRIISFIILPELGNIFVALISMYLYWMCGKQLEQNWGAFKFNIFYLTGFIGSVISGFITGYATNMYLNLSLFLAFALLFPDLKFLLFFIIPIKAKYIAYFMGASLVISFVFSSWGGRIAILFSLANIILFFSGGLYEKIRDKFKYRKVRRKFNIEMSRFNEHKNDNEDEDNDYNDE